MSKQRPAAEPLEARIAPASLVLTDVDGDQVTITTSKGTDAELGAVVVRVASGMGEQIQLIDLASNPVFKGTDISIDVDGIGAKTVNVGYIKADISTGDGSTGIDLGDVFVDGDLGRIDAGDQNLRTTALSSLKVASMGALGVATQQTGGNLSTNIRGKVGTFEVAGDIVEASILIGGGVGAGDVKKLRIGGDIVGGVADDSGHIHATGDIDDIVVFGDLIGGAGEESGNIIADRTIGDAVVGAIIGGTTVGASKFSGRIFALMSIDSVTATGIVGGVGEGSGSIASERNLGTIKITNDVVGGDGIESGSIGSAGTVTKLTVEGVLRGGSAEKSGSILSKGVMKSITLGGIEGGSGPDSGAVGSDNEVQSVTVLGDVVGDGALSGRIGSNTSIKKVVIQGSLVGGYGHSSGQIVSAGAIGSVLVLGNVMGGGGFESGSIGSVGKIASVQINGDLSVVQSGLGGLIASGSGGITKVVIGRDLIGGDIRAIAGSIGSVSIGRNMIGGDTSGRGSIDTDRSVSKVTIGGDLMGGSAPFTGAIKAVENIGTVAITGDIIGTTDQTALISAGSGITSVGARQLIGGDGAFSGLIETFGDPDDSPDIGTVVLTNGILGGQGDNSANVSSSGSIKSIVSGTVQANSGTFSASIFAAEDIAKIVINGGLVGVGDESGKISAGGDIKSLTVQRIQSGTGRYDLTVSSSGELGQVYAGGKISSLRVTQSGLVGGGVYGAAIRAGEIGTISIVGSVQGNDNYAASIVAESGDIDSLAIVGGISGDGFRAGSVHAEGKLKNFRATHISGNSDTAINVSAVEGIGAVKVDEFTAYTNFLAGYNASGSLVNRAAGISAVSIGESPVVSDVLPGVLATNIVAGTSSGSDLSFGTSDDVAGSGASSKTTVIGSIKIGGGVRNLTDGAFTYGISAVFVKKVVVNGTTVALQSGASNDIGLLIGNTSPLADFFLTEANPLSIRA